MKLPLVSIIIPIYNIEKFIRCCVDSVCNQSYKNLDIILVDDGSQDNCPRICDEYSLKDSRIQSLHKINGGLSDARNYGMKFAKGDFIFFLDGDDFIPIDAISHLVDTQQKNDSDIVVGDMALVSEDVSSDFEYVQDKLFSRNLNSEKSIEETIYQKRFSCRAWGKLYRKSVLTVEFPYGKLCEDLAVAHIYLSAAKIITFTSKICCFYRQRNNSIMHQFNPRRMDALDFALNLEEFCKQQYKNLSKEVQCRVFNVAVHLILDMDDSYIDSKNMIFNRTIAEIKRTRLWVIVDPKCRLREKAVALLSFLGVKVIRYIWTHSSIGRTKSIL